MNKLALVMVVLMLGGVASATPASKKCDPFASPHNCDVAQTDAQPAADPAAGKPAGWTGAPSAIPTAAPPSTAADLHKVCADAMNADPAFAKSIVDTVDKQIDVKTIEAHKDAEHHIQKNEAHVIYAYAAMWIVAALFVVFLWRRQQALQLEIGQLRKDLDAAARQGDAK